MRAIFSNRTVIVISIALTVFIATFTWLAVDSSGPLCTEAEKCCVINKPQNGRMIWDDVVNGFLRLGRI